MRAEFIQALCDLARTDERIMLLSGDLGFSVIEPFQRDFPQRFINVGVAEQNMVGIAAGLAMNGFVPVVYSIANFPTLRCFEQIRNDVAYHRLPVIVAAVGAGVGYGALGYSHHAVQDLAVMRTLPGMLIGTPADADEAASVLRAAVTSGAPSYIRLGKSGRPAAPSSAAPLLPGTPMCLHPGNDVAVLGCGQIVEEALAAAPTTGAAVYSLPLWADSEESRSGVRAFVAAHRHVVTVEEHYRAGGFGSYVRECLEGTPYQERLTCLSLDTSTMHMVGDERLLRAAGGISASDIEVALGRLKG